MSFSRRRYPRVMRKRSQRNIKESFRIASVKYNINWLYSTVLIGMIALMVLIYLCQSASLVSVQYSIGQLKMEKSELLTQQKETKLSIENLESLERIEQIAMTKLNMVYPGQRYTLDMGRTSGITQTAQDRIETVSAR
jgi:cell division protein FtsL